MCVKQVDFGGNSFIEFDFLVHYQVIILWLVYITLQFFVIFHSSLNFNLSFGFIIMPPPIIVDAPPEENSTGNPIEATATELQTQLTAVQAAIEGSGQSGLFKPRSFTGLPNEDIKEWLEKFDRFARFYNWTNAKKLCAIALLLDGPALAWYHTQTAETVGNFTNLTDGLKNRFGAQNLEFLLRQELFSRKQGPNEQLSVYTEDIIKKSQRLGLSDKDMMNIFINGLTNEIKTHVILSQPDTFTKAENLARLRDAVMKISGVSGSVVVAQNLSQEAKIKELEGQVNLLISLASQKKDLSANPKPVQAMSQFYSDQAQSQESHFQPKTSNSDLTSMKNEILAAIETKFAAAKISGSVNNAGPPRRGRLPSQVVHEEVPVVEIFAPLMVSLFAIIVVE